MNREPEFETQNTLVELPDEPLESTAVVTEIPLPGSPAVSPAFESATAAEIERRVRGGMFGVPEMVVMGLSGLLLLGMLGFYFLVVAPAQSELKNKKTQRDEQEIQLTNLKTKFDLNEKTGSIVANLEQSVSDFEFRYLPIASIGQTGLYDRLNGLMYAYHLRNTAGPDYVPLEIVTLKNDQPQGERGKNKFQTLFPGVYINMTVEGTYPNLRRFIGEIESSQQFVIISTVELQATENKQEEDQTKFRAPVNPQGANPMGGGPTMGGRMPGGPVMTGPPQQQARPVERKGKTMGEVVSLHIELAAYFRREGAPGSALSAPAVP